MLSPLLRGVVVAIVAALVAAAPDLLGVPSPWPVLLVAGVVLARPSDLAPVVGVLVGASAWWLGMALRAGVLPDTTSALMLAVVVSVAVCTAVAALTHDRIPLWASLIGTAAFAGVYEPMFAANPTRFLTESPLAFGTVVVATAVAAIGGMLAELATTATARTNDTSTVSHQPKEAL